MRDTEKDAMLPHEEFTCDQYVPKDPLARKCLDLSDTFIPSPEEHNCEYALTGCKGFGEGRRVRSAYLRDAWACTDCATKLDRYRPFQRLTSLEATERGR